MPSTARQPLHTKRQQLFVLTALAVAAGVAMSIVVVSRGETVPASEAAASPPQVAGIRLGEPVAGAVQRLGPPDAVETAPDGLERTWRLSETASLVVVSGPAESSPVSGMWAHSGGDEELLLGEAIVLGRNSLAEARRALGGDFTAARYSPSDYVIAYDRCDAVYPVVVKLNRLGMDPDAPPFGPPRRLESDVLSQDSPLWEQPVTSVLVAYADAAPGAVDCG